MPKYTHVDKGLDVLKEIGVVSKWNYEPTKNVYVVHDGNTNGIPAKLYDADKLALENPSGIYSTIISDFNINEEGKGFFYTVKRKLKELYNVIMTHNVSEEGWQDLVPVKSVEVDTDQQESHQLLQKLMDDGKISKQDMLRCNELWKKYKKN